MADIQGNLINSYIFDLDGTIIFDGQPLSAALSYQIMRLAENNRVIFASARPIRDMLPLLPAQLHSCLMVGCNGGMAWQAGQFIFVRKFSATASTTLIGFLQQQGIPYVLDGAWHYALSEKKHPFHDYLLSLSAHQLAQPQLLAQGISKILILDGTSKDKVQQFMAQRGYSFNLTYHRSDELFDITPQRENKYAALQALAVDFGTAVVFGNDANDFAMLDKAALSVFVGNKQIYSQADYYVDTVAVTELLTAING